MNAADNLAQLQHSLTEYKTYLVILCCSHQMSFTYYQEYCKKQHQQTMTSISKHDRKQERKGDD
jgi:hypothetical protein